MSSPYSAAITEHVEKATEWLTDKMSTDIPSGMTDISSLQALRRTVIKKVNRTAFLSEQIEESQRGWQIVQNVMSISERSGDVRTQQTFIEDTQYPKVLAQLKSYLHDLKEFRGELDILLTPALPKLVIPTRRAPTRLPQTLLPIFDGNIEEWPGFWLRFKSKIHDVDSYELSDVEKLDILMNECLKGKAQRSVSHLAEDGANYQAVISKLESDFGNTLAIKESLFHSLQRLSPTTGKREDLRRFIDELEHICTRLDRAGESVESLSIQTTILTKLPRFIQDCLLKSRRNLPTGTAWTTVRMRQFLKDILSDQDELSRVVEMSRTLTVDESHENSQTAKPSRHYSQISEPASFQPTMSFMATNRCISPKQATSHSSNFSRSSRPNLPCLLCNSSDHYGDQCRADMDTRRHKLREDGRCFRCMQTGHTGNFCPNQVQCKYCQKMNHHSYLCFKNPTVDTTQNQKQKSVKSGFPNANDIPLGQYNSFAKNQAHSPHMTQFQHSQSAQKSKHVHFVDENQANDTFPNANYSLIGTGLTASPVPEKRLAVLKCSKFPVYTLHNPQSKSTATLFLDDGSTNSYITRKFAQKIGAMLGRHHSLNIRAMVNTFPVSVQETKVCLDLRSHGQCEFQMLAVDKITEAIPYIIPPSNPDEVNELGYVYQHSEPDILIGNDYYYDINPIPIRQLPNGYVLLDSEIGILIGGKGIPSNHLSMTSQLCVPTFDPLAFNISCNSAESTRQLVPYSAPPLRVLAQSKLANSIPPGFGKVAQDVSATSSVGTIPSTSTEKFNGSDLFLKMDSLIKSNPDKDFSPSFETNIPISSHRYENMTKHGDNSTKGDGTDSLEENLYIAKCHKEQLLPSLEQSSLPKHENFHPIRPPSHSGISTYFPQIHNLSNFHINSKFPKRDFRSNVFPNTSDPPNNVSPGCISSNFYHDEMVSDHKMGTSLHSTPAYSNFRPPRKPPCAKILAQNEISSFCQINSFP